MAAASNRPVAPAAAAATYSFSAQPKPVASTRKKYREPGEVDVAMYRDLKETCITWDKRVHRGNTYGLYTQSAIREAFQEATQEAQPKLRHRRRQKEPNVFDMPLPEKERVAVDLTNHLIAPEEAVEVDVAEAQTDIFLPEQPAEQLQPQKTGADVSTQVEDGELFDFDAEVAPILDVLVNKTLEQSVMEVEEEHELSSMAQFRESWLTRQKTMMKDWRTQVQEERDRWDKKEKLVQRQREVRRRQAQVLLKMQAVEIAREQLADVVPNAMADLDEVAFPDPQAMALDRLFMPHLLRAVQFQVDATVAAERQIDGLIEGIVKRRMDSGAMAAAEHARRREETARQRLEEVQTRQGRIRIVINSGSRGPVSVGPVQISSEDSVQDVEGRVAEWLQTHEPEVATSFPHGIGLRIEGQPVANTLMIFDAKAGTISLEPRAHDAPKEDVHGEGQEDENAEDEE